MKLSSLLRRGASRLTYANVVATLALFIALGGVSYAATKLPKNSVTSSAIKKNAVTNAKIKRSAVDSSKVRNKSITGIDIKDGTITAEKINAAGLTASASGDTFNVFKAATSSASDPNEDTAREAATEIPLITSGPLSLYGKCFTVNSATHFDTYLRSTVDGTAVSAYSIYSAQYEPSLGPGTPEDSRRVNDDETDSADDVDDDYANSVSVLGPDGKGFSFSLVDYARVGNPVSPPGFLPQSGSCAFHVWGSYTK